MRITEVMYCVVAAVCQQVMPLAGQQSKITMRHNVLTDCLGGLEEATQTAWFKMRLHDMNSH